MLGEEDTRTWMEKRGKGKHKEAKEERIEKRLIRKARRPMAGK
jgi:hypothetical protein